MQTMRVPRQNTERQRALETSGFCEKKGVWPYIEHGGGQGSWQEQHYSHPHTPQSRHAASCRSLLRRITTHETQHARWKR
eukprot:1391728-Amorphochlora_amoeboformis.AAC.1